MMVLTHFMLKTSCNFVEFYNLLRGDGKQVWLQRRPWEPYSIPLAMSENRHEATLSWKYTIVMSLM